MLMLYGALFAWMPIPLQIVCCGVLVLFMFIVLLRIIALIMDVIPFL